MQPVHHTFEELFLQLGLGNSQDEIDQFIADHSPLPNHIPLTEAPFWTPAQAEFIRQAIEEDSDWSEVVDELNAALR